MQPSNIAYPGHEIHAIRSTARFPRLHAGGIRVCITILMVAAAHLALAVAAQAQGNPLPVPNQIVTTQDDRVATISWNGFPHWGPDNPPGVYGYQVIWGKANAAPDHTVYVSEPIAQLQPLVNGQPYQAVICAMDGWGHLSAPTGPINFTGSSARVDALRQQMNGFFDDFNQAEGPVDELKWNVATSHCNDPAKNGFFINGQFHAHSMLGDKYGDRGQLVSRPRAPFLIGGRTGTIVFDFDGANRRDFWYLDIMPQYLDITGQASLETAPGYPGNMLRIRESGNRIFIFWIDGNGVSHQVGDSNDLMMYNIKLVTNVRQNWKVQVSQSHVQVFINNKPVCSAQVNIPWTVGFIHWNAFSYNTAKANQPSTLMHWDNFGFDAPAGWKTATVVHNYRTVPYDGSEFTDLSSFVPYSTTVPVPDKLTNATGAHLMFSMEMGSNRFYRWDPKDSVTVNGQRFRIAQPTGGALSQMQLVSGASLYTVTVPLNPKLLKQGLNTVTFAMAQSGVIDVHIEVVFPTQLAPAYTQPYAVSEMIGVPMASVPDMPTVGPGVVMTSLNTTPLYVYLQGSPSQSAQNVLSVSGVISIHAVAGGDVALLSTGKQCCVSQLQFLVDQNVVGSVQTNVQASAVNTEYTFTLDTTKLSNGKHALFVCGLSAAGIPSLPDYTAAGAYNGEYYPLYVNVNN